MFLNLYTHHDYDVFTYFKICRIVGVNIYNQYVHNIQCIGNILVTHILLTHTYLHILNLVYAKPFFCIGLGGLIPLLLLYFLSLIPPNNFKYV